MIISKTSIERSGVGKGIRVGWVSGSHIIHEYVGTFLKVIKTGVNLFSYSNVNNLTKSQLKALLT